MLGLPGRLITPFSKSNRKKKTREHHTISMTIRAHGPLENYMINYNRFILNALNTVYAKKV